MQKDFAFGIIPYYQDGNKVLFLLTQHALGHWSFPKGHPEEKETPAQTAQREFEEETGILNYQVDENTQFKEEYYPQKDGQILHKTVIFFPAKTSTKKVNLQAEEVIDHSWLEYKMALEKLTFNNTKKILKQVKKYLLAKIDQLG
jgi:8-oxo-dGTP pyrophosphatase MutT (NUDIX family)